MKHLKKFESFENNTLNDSREQTIQLIQNRLVDIIDDYRITIEDYKKGLLLCIQYDISNSCMYKKRKLSNVEVSKMLKLIKILQDDGCKIHDILVWYNKGHWDRINFPLNIDYTRFLSEFESFIKNRETSEIKIHIL